MKFKTQNSVFLKERVKIKNFWSINENKTQVFDNERLNNPVIVEKPTDDHKPFHPVSFAELIKRIAANNDSNIIKVPVFPKLEFGKHVEMVCVDPEFKLLPKEVNPKKIKNAKKKGGRLQKNYSCCLPKINGHSKSKNKNLRSKSFLKKFWYGPNKLKIEKF